MVKRKRTNNDLQNIHIKLNTCAYVSVCLHVKNESATDSVVDKQMIFQCTTLCSVFGHALFDRFSCLIKLLRNNIFVSIFKTTLICVFNLIRNLHSRNQTESYYDGNLSSKLYNEHYLHCEFHRTVFVTSYPNLHLTDSQTDRVFVLTIW